MKADWDFIEELAGADATAELLEELEHFDTVHLDSIGPLAYQDYVYALVRHFKPKRVLETGVRSGVSTAMILSALEKNGDGRLFSVDYIYRNQQHAMAEITKATKLELPWNQWTYFCGMSKDVLSHPKANSLGPFDMFIHDSDHGDVNMVRELLWAWAHLAPGGWLICDDWDTCALAPKHDMFVLFAGAVGKTFRVIGSAAVIQK